MRLSPDQEYVLTGNAASTYHDVEVLVDSIKSTLQSSGTTEPGRLIVMVADPLLLVSTIWACIGSHTCAILMDPRNHAEWLRKQAVVLKANWVITDQPSVRMGIPTIALPVKAPREAKTGDASRLADRKPDDEPAFILPTSGTIGSPKWTLITQGQFRDTLQVMWAHGALDKTCNQTVLITPPLTHSYGLSVLLESTYVGHTVALPDTFEPLGVVATLFDTSFNEQVTAAEGTPSFYELLANAISKNVLPHLNRLGFGGGPLNLATLRRLVRHYGSVTVSIRYGLPRIHRWTGMDGVRAAEGGEGVTGAMIRGLEFG